MTSEQVWKQFLDLAQGQRLVEAGDTVIVGVSGGPDSLTLLHLLRRLGLMMRPPLHLVAAHLNHGMRPEAAADAAFVADIARRLDVEHVEEVVDVPAFSAASGLSLEEAARVARYGFLGRTARQWGAQCVAVAHHADDQVETVIMHWLRGAGLAGLRGMAPASALADLRLTPADDDEAEERPLRLIRPLLTCTRAEIEAYCAENGLAARFDRTNLDTTIYRNRLRHELIPYLESFNPNIREVVRRSATVMARDYAYLHSQVMASWVALARQPAVGVFQFELTAWRGLHPALQAGLLREAVRRLRRSLRNINEVHIDQALSVAAGGHAGQRATLPQGLVLTLGYASLWVAEGSWQPAEGRWPTLDSPTTVLPLAVPGTTRLSGEWTLCAELLKREELPAGWEANADPWLAWLDAEHLPLGALCARARRAGERFQPLGMGGCSTDVREFLIGSKVPQGVRARHLLVCAGEHIVWLPGLRLDERARLRPESRLILALSVCYEGANQ